MKTNMAATVRNFRFLTSSLTGLPKVFCLPKHNRCLSNHQIILNQFGDPNKVVKKRTSGFTPNLMDNDILVKMIMAPINPSDVNIIEGTYFIKPPLPAVVGNEGVGEVLDVGQNVRGLTAGDLVIPSGPCFGTWQTYRVTKEEEVIKLPKELPHLSAATVSVNPTTAYRMLKDFVRLSPGDIVIQNGANSGVGISLIQLAREWGIKTINIVRDRPEIEELKKELSTLGADYVITEDFVRTPEMKELLKSLPSKPKLALNCVGGKSATELIRVLDQGGVMVTYGGMSKKPITIPTGALLFKEVKLTGYWNSKWNSEKNNSIARLEMLADLCALIQTGRFLPPKCDFFQLEEYENALESTTKGFTNKAVFCMD